MGKYCVNSEEKEDEVINVLECMVEPDYGGCWERETWTQHGRKLVILCALKQERDTWKWFLRKKNLAAAHRVSWIREVNARVTISWIWKAENIERQQGRGAGLSPRDIFIDKINTKRSHCAIRRAVLVSAGNTLPKDTHTKRNPFLFGRFLKNSSLRASESKAKDPSFRGPRVTFHLDPV